MSLLWIMFFFFFCWVCTFFVVGLVDSRLSNLGSVFIIGQIWLFNWVRDHKVLLTCFGVDDWFRLIQVTYWNPFFNPHYQNRQTLRLGHLFLHTETIQKSLQTHPHHYPHEWRNQISPRFQAFTSFCSNYCQQTYRSAAYFSVPTQSNRQKSR